MLLAGLLVVLLAILLLRRLPPATRCGRRCGLPGPGRGLAVHLALSAALV